MKLKKLCYVASVALAACLAGSASAQNWSGLGDSTTWSQGANWVGGVAPTPSAYQVYLGTGFPTASLLPITIGASDVVQVSDGIFGPEWGQTLNIHGTVKSGYFFPVGAVGGPTSVVNLYTNSSYNAGNTIALGDVWWFAGGPNVVMNLYDNSQVATLYLALGGHLNLYGGTVTVSNVIFTGTAGAGQWGSALSTDATRLINLVNGKLILPAGFTSVVNYYIISRGILFAYGKKYQTVDIVINEADPNYPGHTVVSTIPLGGSLQSVHLAPRTNMMLGTFQQIDVLGDYPGVTNVVMRYLDPATVPTPTFQSSAPNVVSVTTDGHAVALSPGSANITVTFGAFSSTNSITVTPFTSSLVHRYSFSETSGTTTADSVPGNSPAWDGTLNGGATLGGGQVTLDGSSGYVQLPAGIVSNLDAVTVEAWANFGTPAAWAALFDFGDQDGLISPQGMNYIGFEPFTGIPTNSTAAVLYGRGDPGNANDQGTAISLVSGGVTNYLGNVQIVAVFHPYAGYVSLYTNGLLAAINSNVSSPLAATLGADPLNWLGQSLYAIDPFLNASINEFRIYNGPRSTSQIMADYALGPNQLIGTSTSVSLSVSLSGANLMVTWPTNSALVTLMSSPVLGPGAVWTPVIGNLAVVGGNYQMAIPTTGSARYFRLQL